MITGNMEKSKIDKYLKSPNHCIYCGSNYIESPIGENEAEDTEIITNVYCNSCHREWKEVYTLTTIKEIGDE